MNFVQRAAGIGAVTAALVGGMAVAAPGAGAATAQATYNGACGSGYKVVNSAPVGTVGTIFLTYSSRTGMNCVVTIRTHPGSAVHMLAAVTNDQDIDPEFDDGYYTTYAGPAYTTAFNQCVNWWGAIGNATGGKNHTNCGS